MVDPTHKYIQMIEEEEIKSSQSVKRAVERFKNDLKRDDWEWEYKPELADRAVRFMSILPDQKTGKPQPLANFQKFIIANIFGWVSKNDSDIRRFTDVFISIARKNGKSLLISGVIIYEFLFGKYPKKRRQLYTAANDRKQANIILDMVKDRLKALKAMDEGVRKAVRIKRDEIVNLRDDSYVRSFSKEAGLVNGYEPQVSVVDEYADSKTDDMLETLTSGQTLLKSPLTFIISTAGFNLNVPMYTKNYPSAKKVLSGEEDEPRSFIFIAEAENKTEVDDPECFIKSNPLMEVDELKEQMTGYLKKRVSTAKHSGSLNKVLIKNFNMWTQSEDNAYLDIVEWNKSRANEPIDLTGKNVYVGIDVGRTSDLFAVSWIYPHNDKFYVDGYAFVATKYGLEEKIKSDKLDYVDLENKGQCETSKLDSGVIDYDRVFDYIETHVKANNLVVQAICYDPYQFGPLMTKMEKSHPEWNLIAIRQGTITLSMPTKQFKDDLLNGKIIHSDNELLRNSFMNAVLLSDNNGVRINKNRNSDKIDLADATLTGYAVAFREDDQPVMTNERAMSDNLF